MVHQEQRDKDILFFPAAVTITQMCLRCDLLFLLSFQKNKKGEADSAVTVWLTPDAKPVHHHHQLWCIYRQIYRCGRAQPWGSLNGQKQTIDNDGEIAKGPRLQPYWSLIIIESFVTSQDIIVSTEWQCVTVCVCVRFGQILFLYFALANGFN